MKKILIMLFVCTFIMTGCKSQNNKPVEDNDQTQVNTDEEKKGIYIDTNYFTVTLPDDWKGLYDYEIISGEMDNEYSVVFYEKESHKEIEGGLCLAFLCMRRVLIIRTYLHMKNWEF